MRPLDPLVALRAEHSFFSSMRTQIDAEQMGIARQHQFRITKTVKIGSLLPRDRRGLPQHDGKRR